MPNHDQAEFFSRRGALKRLSNTAALPLLGNTRFLLADQKPSSPVDLQHGLAGYWKLQGDCRDHSGGGHHGINHGVDLQSGAFDGRGAFIEVPAKDALQLTRSCAGA